MALTLVTPVATEPISLAEAKAHCRVDVSDDDLLLSSLITAGREWAETYTHRAIPPQTWDYKLDGSPCGDVLELPKAPVTSITSISYVDTVGTTQTWSSTFYTTDLPTGPWAGPGRIAPAYGYTWPQARDVMNAFTVRFVAGYTTAPEAV